MGYSWVEREGQREQAEREGQREQSPRGMTPHTQVETKSTCSMRTVVDMATAFKGRVQGGGTSGDPVF